MFFTNSGRRLSTPRSRSRLPMHRVRGEGTRTRLIGRERGYHGVGFGGISVGGMVNNRKFFARAAAGRRSPAAHARPRPQCLVTRGQPEHGAALADELERLVALHDASTIAAVIVEPVAGSTGVLLPPRGYLQRLREICTRHGILLIFDEVITGFGRLGTPFAAQCFDVLPDMITMAKGLTNGAVPAGAVAVRGDIYQTLHDRAGQCDRALPRLHVLGASGRLRRGLATQQIYRRDGLLTARTRWVVTGPTLCIRLKEGRT